MDDADGGVDEDLDVDEADEIDVDDNDDEAAQDQEPAGPDDAVVVFAGHSGADRNGPRHARARASHALPGPPRTRRGPRVQTLYTRAR